MSQALVLLKQNGNYSFDALRKNKKHQHHGLDIDRGLVSSIKSPYKLEDFFEAVQCDLHVSTTGEPWGHFANFYRSLVTIPPSLSNQIFDYGRNAYLDVVSLTAGPDSPAIDALKSSRFNSFQLMKTLPDMFPLFAELDIRPYLCRGNALAKHVRHYETDDQGNKQLDYTQITTYFTLNGILPEWKNNLINSFNKYGHPVGLDESFGASMAFQLEFNIKANEAVPTFFPDIVEDVNNQKFYVFPEGDYISEPATYLIILYCLGMLSRYYPDIWVSVVDENVQIAEFTDSLLNIVQRKFPNLILDQMTSAKHYIHL